MGVRFFAVNDGLVCISCAPPKSTFTFQGFAAHFSSFVNLFYIFFDFILSLFPT